MPVSRPPARLTVRTEVPPLGWSLVLGAGLVAVFAVGVRVLVPDEGTGDAHGTASRTHSPARVGLATLCFLVVALGVALGLTYIVAAGQGKVLSFDHGYPTLVPQP